MLVARQKRKENIVEYLLYMWQVEDLIRAYQFDMDAIRKNLVGQFECEPKEQEEVAAWYENLLVMMQKENITQKGHLQILKNQLNDVFELHQALLKVNLFPDYVRAYQKAKGNIDSFAQKEGAEGENELETCLNALYGILMLRLQKKKVSSETMNAVTTFTQLLALLSAYYKKSEKGELDL